jgi:glyoxylase-like metal-dependent hydrolase (beta-lactamase superfamily II)
MTLPTSHQIGAARITRIDELLLSEVVPSGLLPSFDPRVLVDHPDWIAGGAGDAARQILSVSVHAWLVQEAGRTILIDTGAGNDKERPHSAMFHQLQNPFLGQLKAAGVAPEDIDYVLSTHLHVDHVGWNTRLENGRWVPTFPHAKYIFSRAERAYFTDPVNHSQRNRTHFATQRDSIDPIIEAGLAQMIEVDGSEPIEGFIFHLSPGHSIAHASIEMRSDGEMAFFAGDVFHHPLQIYETGWHSVYDAFPEVAEKSRLWALNFAADHEAPLFSTHFAGTSVGTIQREGSGFRWRFR